MRLERTTGATNMVDVLERVLDKGIVIDAWLLLSVAGISLVTVEARVVVASIETYVNHAHVAPFGPLVATPVEPAGHRTPLSKRSRES